MPVTKRIAHFAYEKIHERLVHTCKFCILANTEFRQPKKRTVSLLFITNRSDCADFRSSLNATTLHAAILSVGRNFDERSWRLCSRASFTRRRTRKFNTRDTIHHVREMQHDRNTLSLKGIVLRRGPSRTGQGDNVAFFSHVRDCYPRVTTVDFTNAFDVCYLFKTISHHASHLPPVLRATTIKCISNTQSALIKTFYFPWWTTLRTRTRC